MSRPSARLLLTAAGLLGWGSLFAQAGDYYDGVDATSPESLRGSLHELIDDHQRFPYTSSETDTWDILEEADADQDESDRVVGIYRNASFARRGGGNSFYNREHVWPKSYGFPDNDESLNYPYTDTHSLFLADDDYNFARSNHPFDYCADSCNEYVTVANDGRGDTGEGYPGDSNWQTGEFTEGKWEVWNGRRGDVARALMYMDVRYEGGVHGVTGASEPDLVLTDDLQLIDQSNTGSNEDFGYMGMLSVLLEWHWQDPVDDVERQHHETVASYQGNRNPFIDHPEWASCVFGGDCGFTINAGITDAWYNPDTDGQGFFIIVWEEIKLIFLGWFTYDAERPPEDVQAILGEPGHRWLTAQGPYDGDTAQLDIYVTRGAIFDSEEPEVDDPRALDGTIELKFVDCETGTVRYEIPSAELSGEIPIQRIIGSNVALCETLSEGGQPSAQRE